MTDRYLGSIAEEAENKKQRISREEETNRRRKKKDSVAEKEREMPVNSS